MIRNMCCAKADAAAALDAAPVGVFAFVGNDGLPRACAVTPYLDADQTLVTSTLAFTAKVAAVRRDPRVALLAGGCLVRGRAAVNVDLTSKTFDERVRSQELRSIRRRRPLPSPAIGGSCGGTSGARLSPSPSTTASRRPDPTAARSPSSTEGCPGSRLSIPLPTSRQTRSRSRSPETAPPACSSTTRTPAWRTYASSPCTAPSATGPSASSGAPDHLTQRTRELSTSSAHSESSGAPPARTARYLPAGLGRPAG